MQHPVLTRKHPGCPPLRRESTIPEYFRKVEPSSPVEVPVATAPTQVWDETNDLERDEYFVENAYVIVERPLIQNYITCKGRASDQEKEKCK